MNLFRYFALWPRLEADIVIECFGGNNMIKTLIRLMVCMGLLIFVIVLMPALGTAKSSESENILIRNVRLIDRSGQAEDQSVNILIKETKLNIITKDEIELKEGLIGFDAQNGVLMGNLDIGQPANFMIIDKNPRDDFEVLLDTKTHVVFAIRNGTIVRNALPLVTAAEPEPEEKKAPRWLAYTPPPMALPVSYQDTTKWNCWETRYFSGIFVAALALDRQRWLTQDENSKDQVGGLKEYDGGEIRAFRFGIAGTLNFKKPWFYQFVIHTHAFDQGYDSKTTDDFTFLDYRLDIPFWKQLTLSVGKQKEPISMDRLLMGTQLQMAERATVLDAMFQVRNFGIVISGAGFFGGRMTGAVGVFNEWLVTSGKSFNESASQITARFTGLPFISKDDSNLIHLALGIRYNDAKEGLGYRSRPEFNQAPVYVDTGAFEAEHTLTYDLEVSLRRGPFWLASEWVHNRVKAPELENPVFSGFHISGSWTLTGEMRPYNKRNGTLGPVPVSKSIHQGGLGAWELSTRYSSLDLSDGLIDGGKIGVVSLGLNWYLTPTFTFNLNYRYILLDHFGIRGRSSGIMARVILLLE